MANKKRGYICKECGFTNQKWMGKCPACDEWNTFDELTVTEKEFQKKSNIMTGTGKEEAPVKIISLSEISISDCKRHSTKFAELDRVLGGGLVSGSTVLLGGEPGIGKSTILLQVSLTLASNGFKVLYVSGEESPSQIRLRAERIGIIHGNLYFLATSSVEKIEEAFHSLNPNILIVDSIQTCKTNTHPSSPGSIAQVRESAYLLNQLLDFSISGDEGKKVHPDRAILIMTAHITKEGSIAGPKILEHLVDCVLYFEGERLRNLRIIRAFKNRFGAINEIGLFQMTEKGLEEVQNPANFFLEQDGHTASPGSVLVPVQEGSLILLLEVQSLVNEILYQAPRRASEGVELNRVQLMAAVLDKIGELNLRNFDIFVKISGGVNVDDPALDLALLVSLASSLKQVPVPVDMCIFGEVALSGKLRPVTMLEHRLKALEGLKISKVIMPQGQGYEEKIFSGEIFLAKNIGEVLEYVFQ